MKRTLEELQENFKNLMGENTSDDMLSFLEDMTDTYQKDEIDWEAKYKENDATWRQKYRDRFYSDVTPEKDEFIEEEKPVMKTKFEELFKEG